MKISVQKPLVHKCDNDKNLVRKYVFIHLLFLIFEVYLMFCMKSDAVEASAYLCV